MTNHPSSIIIDDIGVLDSQEAQQIILTIRTSMEATRLLLVRLFKGKAWLSLGYDSWHDLLVNEFPEFHHTYLRRITSAGLLEERIGRSVGSTKESHLRPILSILDDETVQEFAYEYAQEHGARTGKDHERYAFEVYVRAYADPYVVDRLERGYLSPKQAYQITKELEDVESPEVYDVGRMVTDSELIPMFTRLHKQQSETWNEIYLSKCIPAFPDPIPLHIATTHNLMAWLDEASAEHRARARLSRAEWYGKRNEAVEQVITSAWCVRRGEAGLETLFNALDSLKEIEHEHPSA